MSDTISFLPHYDFSPALNTGYLRKILQLMVQHQTPATPINYAIWYDVVTEKNPQLSLAVDALLREKSPFDAATSLALYKKYICNTSVASFEKINDQIQTLIGKTSTALQETHTKADSAQLSFQKNTVLLEHVSNADELSVTLQQIIQETHSLTEATQSMQIKLDNAHQELEKMRQELTHVRQVATTDALTGLLNRHAFDQALAALFEQPRQSSTCLCLLDIDHFKRVNDLYGHVVGDKVIQFVAALMKKHANDQHYVARYGGEEMTIIMPDTTRAEAFTISNTIKNALENSVLKRKDNGEPLGKITVSIGISVLQANDNAETFLIRADQALYSAKETGRNKVVCTDY